ncbi:MAG: hypothetical protein JW891_14420 [Candidatus Lokiarchaeota archaeon]|nr:hypothetical protein [Candidatus Lokiarchaeota archaeon]
MTIDKWLAFGSNENKKKIDKKFNKLSEQEIIELKKKQLRKVIIGKNSKTHEKEVLPSDFLSTVIQFKEWLNSRSYLKGDLEKIEMWVRNLNTKLKVEAQKESKIEIKSRIIDLKEKYRNIPPDFLDEKTRIAINKKIIGQTLTTSDHYYLKKLKQVIQLKLKEEKQYNVLNDILKL